MANRRNEVPKQKSQAASTDHSSMFSTCTVESVQPTPASSTTKLLAKTLTTPPHEDELRLFPIGTTVVKESGSRALSGQVYDYRVPYWRVQYEDNDWE